MPKTPLLTDQELRIIARMKELGVLEDINPAKIESAVFVFCGDCERADDIEDWHRRTYESFHGARGHFHRLAWNGGPLALAYQGERASDDFGIIRDWQLDQIRGGLCLKKHLLKRVKHVSHWPCGQARAWGLSLLDALDVSSQAFSFVNRNTAGDSSLCGTVGKPIDVVSRLHIDYNREKMNTYHFCPRLYTEHREELRSVG